MAQATYRVGEAAEILGVQPATIRRWEREGKLHAERTAGGQREILAADVARLLAARTERLPPITGQSVRNRFPGIITSVEKDRLVAVVEVQAGPHRFVSLITREAAEQLGLKPGMSAIAAVKATNVFIEVAET